MARRKERTNDSNALAAIGTTADALASAHQKWSAAGIDGLLIKPFSLSVLMDRLSVFSPSGGG